MEIVSCPSCGANARVPSDRGLLKVKCPSCATRYFYPATSEFSEVQFRCSRDGATFLVATRRHRPDDRFQIHRIAPLSASKSSQLVPTEAVAAAPDGPAHTTHAAHEYDWSGFYCPCCGYIPRGSDTEFVQCGKCREFVCGESITKETTGTRYFRCYPTCGGEGVVTGKIKEYAGDQHTEANRPEYVSIASTEAPKLTGARSSLPTPPGSAKR
jgi:hypothetical protein